MSEHCGCAYRYRKDGTTERDHSAVCRERTALLAEVERLREQNEVLKALLVQFRANLRGNIGRIPRNQLVFVAEVIQARIDAALRLIDPELAALLPEEPIDPKPSER